MEKLLYPNPQFIRTKWLDLNGEWDFCFDDENLGLIKENFKEKTFFDKKINVPYSHHTKKSGIQDKSNHPYIWYAKEFSVEKAKDNAYLLHFGAVDYSCDIWVNDCHVYHHQGGHVPFSVDITDRIETINRLVLRVQDETSCRQPIGKQSWKDHNFLCWYTRTAGIWQQVWLETTGTSYLTDVKVTPDIDNASIEIDACINNDQPETKLEATIHYGKEFIGSAAVSFKNKRARFSVDISSESPNFRLNFWTPNTPNLYDIRFKVIDSQQRVQDQVDSYFGMRNIETKQEKIYLNNQEFYQKLILDQGYFKDGGLTATPEELLDDVKKIKEMGFNGVRKHQKIEDHRFMYLCDIYGLVMWAEMPSPFEYSDETNQNMTRELYPFVKKHYNHPSVIAYTVMNESWGINEVYKDKKEQNFVNALYYLVKSMDDTRLVVGNDGWEHTITDILTIHDYNDDAESLKDSYRDIERAANGSPSKTSTRHAYSEGYSYTGIPFMVSEYGGIAYEDKVGESDEAWGYGDRLTNKEDVLERIKALTQALMDTEGMCGFCYTQLSDVEQEVNGLLDANHQYKFDPKKIKQIMDYKHTLGFVFV